MKRIFSVAGVIGVTIIAVAALALTALYSRTYLTSGDLAAVVSATLVDLTNEDREDEELSTLTINPLLVAAAQAKADDMAAKGYFAHTSPEGVAPWHWFQQAGYGFSYAGENLAVDFRDSEDVAQAWMESPTHRANILNGNFTEIGIATAVGEYRGREATFVVQMFGTPRAGVAAEPIVIQEPESESIAVLGSSAEAKAAYVERPDAEPPILEEQTTMIEYAAPAEELAASPKSFLRLLYVIAAVLLLLALLVVTRLEFKRHHTPKAMAAMGMMMVLLLLFVVADRYLFPSPTIGEERTEV
ncbi:MAG: CAP domain-containing protein [Patescibacteria group bacterium]